MRKLILIGTALLLCLSCTKKREAVTVRLHALGDSTTEIQNQNLKNQRGWPQVLAHFFTEDVVVMTHGKSGTSSKTFREHGFWEKARPHILPGDYVVIQFAHNDEKHGGYDGQIGTVAGGSYREHLQSYVDEIRDLGAIPVFATPIVRKMWDEKGSINRRGRHDLGEHIHFHLDSAVDLADTVTFNYPHNMREVAARNGCPVIDLTVSSARLAEELGNDIATRRIYNFGDDTHICAEGALLYSALFVSEMKEKGLLSEYIREDPGFVVEPGAVVWDEMVIGGEYIQEIDLMKLRKDTAFRAFEVVAGENLQVSVSRFGEYMDRVIIPADFDAVYYRQLFVKALPAIDGRFQSCVRIDDGERKVTVPLTGHVRPVALGETVRVNYSLNGNDRAEVTGPAIGLEHTLSGLEHIGFPRLHGQSNRYEEISVPGGFWPGKEIDVVHDRYAQFGLKPAQGISVRVEKVTLSVGGDVSFRTMASTDPYFSVYTVLGEGTATDIASVEFSTAYDLSDRQTLYIRIYPWSLKTDVSFFLGNVGIDGKSL